MLFDEPVLVRQHTGEREAHADRDDREHDREERAERIVDLLVVQVGQSTIERHTGDHDDDSRHGQGHAREARPAGHKDGEKASCERGKTDASRGRNAEFQVQGDTSSVDNGTDESGRRTHALRRIEKHCEPVRGNEAGEEAQKVVAPWNERNAVLGRHRPAEDSRDRPDSHTR